MKALQDLYVMRGERKTKTVEMHFSSVEANYEIGRPPIKIVYTFLTIDEFGDGYYWEVREGKK